MTFTAIVLLAFSLIIAAITMLFLIPWNILAAIPGILHKEDPLAAGIVFSAMLAPLFGMARGNAQIDRRSFHQHPFNGYRLRIDHLWLREIADVKSAIESGLTYADGDTNIGSECRGYEAGSAEHRCDQKTFHRKPLIVMIL